MRSLWRVAFPRPWLGISWQLFNCWRCPSPHFGGGSLYRSSAGRGWALGLNLGYRHSGAWAHFRRENDLFQSAFLDKPTCFSFSSFVSFPSGFFWTLCKEHIIVTTSHDSRQLPTTSGWAMFRGLPLAGLLEGEHWHMEFGPLTIELSVDSSECLHHCN